MKKELSKYLYKEEVYFRFNGKRYFLKYAFPKIYDTEKAATALIAPSNKPQCVIVLRKGVDARVHIMQHGEVVARMGNGDRYCTLYICESDTNIITDKELTLVTDWNTVFKDFKGELKTQKLSHEIYELKEGEEEINRVFIVYCNSII